MPAPFFAASARRCRGLLRVLILTIALSNEAEAQLAIRDVTVIDGTGAAARSHQTVVLEHGRIAMVGPTAVVRIPRGSRVIDGAGRFLLPGFVDTHVHTSIGPVSLDTTTSPPTMRSTDDVVGSREALRTLLAFGVTTIRDPGGGRKPRSRSATRCGLAGCPVLVCSRLVP